MITDAISRRIRRISSALAERNRRVRDIERLEDMSEALLQDIGLMRHDLRTRGRRRFP